MVRSQWKRRVDGVLVFNKPVGLSSNAALQRVRAIYSAAKAGHTGSLDPLASGVLPICMGEATKLSQYLLDADKEYVTTISLGVTTDTGDASGRILSSRPTAHLDARTVENVLSRFVGALEQIPPMYSALKRNGVPLYRLARRGESVERAPRLVCIHELECIAFSGGDRAMLRLRTRVSKGTYIRVLAEDIGAALDCGAHVAELHRTWAGGFSDTDAVDLAQIEAMGASRDYSALDALLRAPVCAVSHLPEVKLSDADCRALMQGRVVTHTRAAVHGLVRASDPMGAFRGIAELRHDGLIRARRMMSVES